jgi:hypothetical protein
MKKQLLFRGGTMNLEQVFQLFRDKNVKRSFVKRLSPNDNSKNQPYFGGDLAVLNLLPAGEMTAEQTSSEKKSKSSTRFKAPLQFFWLDDSGSAYPAPNTQLIFYPQYPEMRLSGFIRGAQWAPKELMDPNKRGREEGRILLLGTNDRGEIYSYLADKKSTIGKELEEYNLLTTDSVLDEIEWLASTENSEQVLLKELRRIHETGWIHGKRLLADGSYVTCDSNPNCGGYTMEAELGVSANGYAEPDFLGWEVKQYGVKSFGTNASHNITLMTPEPDSGIYYDEGVLPFLHKFGYADRKGRPDRQNFGGIYKYQKASELTGIRLELIGYDADKGKIIDSSGGVALVSATDEIAAMWSFSKLIDHWKRKHAKTVYIPSMKTEKPFHYHFGKDVTLCKGTDFMIFLEAARRGSVYLDPAVKAEEFSTASPVVKRRNQMRISFKNISNIYHSVETLDCTQF